MLVVCRFPDLFSSYFLIDFKVSFYIQLQTDAHLHAQTHKTNKQTKKQMCRLYDFNDKELSRISPVVGSAPRTTGQGRGGTL